MGLFEKTKTSTDYLKEIAKSQKNQEKAAKEQAKAANAAAKENLSQKIEHLAKAGQVWAERDIRKAEAEAKRAETQRLKREAMLVEEERCRQKLQDFYDSFDFNPNDATDIEQKAMSIISWLDTVDRTFKDKKSKNVDDDNKSKEAVLIKKLALAVERLKVLNLDPASTEYVAGKLTFYQDRDTAEKEAIQNEKKRKQSEAREIAEKKRKRKNITIKVLSLIISVVVIIVTIQLLIPHPKRDAADCRAMVYKNIEKGDLQRAKKYIINYEGSKWHLDEATHALIGAFVKCGDLDQAKATFEFLSWGEYSISLGEAFIAKGQYDEAHKYWFKNDCYKACIKHMCENNQFDEAIKYVKRESTDIDKESRVKWVQEMNQIINSYR